MTFPVGDYIRWNTHPVSKYARDLAFWARKNKQGVPTIRLNKGDYLSYAEVYRRAMQGMWQAHVAPVCAGVKIRPKKVKATVQNNPTPLLRGRSHRVLCL